LDFFKQPKSANLNFFVLMLLNQNSTHGYELIKKIEEKTSNQWKPSHGAIYKTLNDLEKKGYLEAGEPGERQQIPYKLTGKGRKLVEKIRIQFRKSWQAYLQIIVENERLNLLPLILDFLWNDGNWDYFQDFNVEKQMSLLKEAKSWLEDKLRIIERKIKEIAAK